MIGTAIDKKKFVLLFFLFWMIVCLSSCGKKKNIIEADFYTLELPEGWSYEVVSEESGYIDCMDENNEVMFRISPHEPYLRDGYDGNLEGLVRHYGMHYFLIENEEILQGEDYTIEKLKVYIEATPPESARGVEDREEYFFWVLSDIGAQLNFCNLSEENLDEIEEIVKSVQIDLDKDEVYLYVKSFL